MRIKVTGNWKNADVTLVHMWSQTGVPFCEEHIKPFGKQSCNADFNAPIYRDMKSCQCIYLVRSSTKLTANANKLIHLLSEK